MKPIDFPEKTCVYAENQPEYIPLPVHKTEDGIVTSCWKLSLKERIRVLFSGKIWCGIMTFNKPLQPQKLSIEKQF